MPDPGSPKPEVVLSDADAPLLSQAQPRGDMTITNALSRKAKEEPISNRGVVSRAKRGVRCSTLLQCTFECVQYMPEASAEFMRVLYALNSVSAVSVQNLLSFVEQARCCEPDLP